LKWFFDSSALVPVFYADHPQHIPTKNVYLAASKQDFCALRSLGEIYATLTGLPLRPRITASQGIAIVRQLRERLTVIHLDQEEYFAALEAAASATIVGAAAYDALIAHCALKSGAQVLITWNVRDFVRLDPQVARLVKTPIEI
jgi:predicted nucleic acid-binding protein